MEVGLFPTLAPQIGLGHAGRAGLPKAKRSKSPLTRIRNEKVGVRFLSSAPATAREARYRSVSGLRRSGPMYGPM